MNSQPLSVLLVGGTGSIGRHVARRALGGHTRALGACAAVPGKRARPRTRWPGSMWLTFVQMASTVPARSQPGVKGSSMIPPAAMSPPNAR